MQPSYEVPKAPSKPSLAKPDRPGELPLSMEATEMRNRNPAKASGVARAQNALECKLLWQILDHRF